MAAIVNFGYATGNTIVCVPIAGWGMRIAFEILQLSRIDVSFVIGVLLTVATLFITIKCLFGDIVSEDIFLQEDELLSDCEWDYQHIKYRKSIFLRKGAIALVGKQVNELRNRKRPIVCDIKTVLFSMLNIFITIGMSQTVDSEGNAVPFSYLNFPHQ